MEKLKYIEGYKSSLSIKENEEAIKDIRSKFQDLLEARLSLLRVTAPLFVESNTGINDDLNGVEKPVNFNVDDNINLEIVHSLAKWKRDNVAKYGLTAGEGIVTNMNAIRKDEIRDNIHSIYVDQWDYEVIINKEERTIATLQKYVGKVYTCIYNTEKYVEEKYGIQSILPDKIAFITSCELMQLYPDLEPSERVSEFVKKHKAAFVAQIGFPLADGKAQDGRAPDYDDWNLNGDIFVYNPVLDEALELSSMGIRVDAEALITQAKASNKEFILDLPYQQRVINEEVPFTLGGGIGQSRICMFMLKKLHIGEVQASYWSEETRKTLEEKEVILL